MDSSADLSGARKWVHDQFLVSWEALLLDDELEERGKEWWGPWVSHYLKDWPWLVHTVHRVSKKEIGGIRDSWVQFCPQFQKLDSITSITCSWLEQPKRPFQNQWTESACLIASVVSDSATTWTVACRAALSMEFPRQEYWSGLPFPSPTNGETEAISSWEGLPSIDIFAPLSRWGRCSPHCC